MHQFPLTPLQRYLELDDQFEQERRAMRGRDKEREKRERDLEKKAREQADQSKPNFPTSVLWCLRATAVQRCRLFFFLVCFFFFFNPSQFGALPDTTH